MVVKIRVEGLRESEANLVDLVKRFGLSNATARNAIKRALTSSGKPIVDEAKALAPVEFGSLKLSITAGTKLSKRQRSMHRKGSPIEVFVGAGPYPQAHLQEFGTVDQPPQRFLTPAADHNIGEVTRRFSSDLRDELAKVESRARRRLARVIAKRG